VVLDEAHRMKRGWPGLWGRACLNLAYLAERRDILTGTPAPQSPRDLVSLLDFIWPGQAQRILPSGASVNPPPPDIGHQIAARVGPLFVRTRKQELGLREPTFSVIVVEPEPLQRAIYDALKDRYAGVFSLSATDRVSFSQLGDVVMYLLEAAVNPHLLVAGSSADDAPRFHHPPLDVQPGSRLWGLLQEYNKFETPAKFKVLAQIVDANARQGRKTLVWSNFVRNLVTLKRMFSSLNPALIYGAVPTENDSRSGITTTRESELRRFREDADCMVLLANPAAMSEGVSLHTTCHDAIYLDRTFNAGQYLQSVDRIHRLGLEADQETRVTFLVSDATIDQIVDQRVRGKAERLGDMLNDPDIVMMSLPDDEDYGPAIDDQGDIGALLAHLGGD
jgi:SNF2 family DNA or RNA helicase